ncbi:metal-binding protein [Legionella norrlandica]|uniref:Metal-binding protein n=1 Tax=Legionella norrlandica TaxID=1498499 RepID=A0A0A2T951_9GAMM|nr:metal-binding protein [Legionella norrlandica]KGP63923.1 metal-binding protein [Legionella norrlandica]
MIHLQELAKQGQQESEVALSERLPSFIRPVCHLKAIYHVEAKEDVYLIHLNVQGNLSIICQRCMDDFTVGYENSTVIAVCRNDERAEQLLSQYECVVSSNWQVDLNELIIDELHLYAPQFHSDFNECNSEINEILTGEKESN